MSKVTYFATILLLCYQSSLASDSTRVEAEVTCHGKTLLQAKRLAALPELHRQAKSVPGDNHCGLEQSCCSNHELDSVKGLFVYADYYLDMGEFFSERMSANPEDLYFIVLGILSLPGGPGASLQFTDQMRDALKRVVAAEISCIKDFDNAVYTFINTLISYMASLSCSACDPGSDKYLIEGKEDFTLYMNPSMCNKINSDFERVVSSLVEFVSKKDFVLAFEDFAEAICLAAVPDNSQCDKELLKALVDHFMKKFVSEKSIHQMLCGQESCKKMICGEVLHGLALDLEPVLKNVKIFIKENCIESSGCVAKDMNQLIDDLAVVAKDLNTNGKPVNNTFTTFHEKFMPLNAWDKACSTKLSRRVCKDADVDSDTTYDDDHRHKHESGGSGAVGTFFLVVFILGTIGGLGFVAYKKYYLRSGTNFVAGNAYNSIAGSNEI
mmetsp:Transcript_13884/g.16840  ORF Transcript_13884/g.16840 Transcript_13884/m.16840 type:complete len:439 (-) Transcript_13884:1056-2372(-)